jgi:pullulanase-type alpha-1,6-glucosidase
VWAPTAQAVRLVRFDTNLAELESLAMTSSTSGTWVIDALPTWYGTYYQFEVKAYHYTTDRIETLRTTDPYSVALSPNGRHSFIVDLDDPNTKPADWDGLVKPDRVQAPEDISIYELHVRDFSIDDATVPEAHRGKFLAFTHNGVTQPDTSRGVAHLKTLSSAGLTVVQFLPSFDYATVDELPSQRVDITDRFDRLCSVNPEVPAALCAQNRTKTIKEVLAGFEPTSPDAQALMQYIRPFDGFNWGYDPLHYSAPEGGYATDPFGGKRIWEMRSAVKALAEIGLRISLDVVYNHTNASGTGDQAVLDRLVPGYYHRRNINTGNVEQSTCCANTATEHRMMEKLMIDSLLVWARAYKVDAFRFDLMGHHMKRNMTKALATLQALTPARDGVDGSKIYFYGEGWNFGEVATNARGVNATQLNMNGTGIGTFSDRLRDAVRGGGAFDSGRALVSNQGFISGLFYDPNTPDKMPAADARAKLLIAGDQIKVGLAGNLRSFRVTTYMGSTVAGSLVAYSGQPTGYTDDPQEVITYVDKHDNQTLFDISAYKTPANTDMATRARIQALGISFVALGQGVPFFHAGMEILRSKSMERDSYDSGDWWNALDYSLESTRWNVGLPREDKDGGNWDTIRGLCQDRSIAPTRVHLERTRDHFLEMLSVRASSPLFRLRTADDVKRRVDFANVGPAQTPGLIAMTITDGACAGADLDPVIDAFAVFFNATTAQQTIELPGAAGFVLHPVLAASTDPVVRTATASSGQFTIPARTTAVFVSPQHGAQCSGLPCNER